MQEDPDIIVCPTTTWYLRRLVMGILFLALAGWFFYDWKVAYPRDYEKYKEWRPLYEEMVLSKKVEGKDTEGSNAGYVKFAEMARQKGWPEETKEMDYPSKIQNQLYCGIGAAVVGLGVLVAFLLNRGRPLRADREAILTPWGKRVPFAAVSQVDKRKWENKWLAYAKYQKPDGNPGRAVIDGFIYKDAQLVLDRLLANFSGEVLELAKEDPVDEEKPAEETRPGAGDKAADPADDAGANARGAETRDD